jgi:predicted TPR repeat methyltransferase
MLHDPLASSDLIAERRFAYAKAAAADADWSAAADLLEQVLERAPHWAAASFALGEARERVGDVEGAAEAFRSTLAADPSDAQGAAARLALIGRGGAPVALPEVYLTRLFNDYAPRFDAHLTGDLAYRGPALVVDALDWAAPGRRFAAALDIGCGTGLMGQALRGRVDRLTGVDLSPGMVAKARERGLYHALEAGEATAFLIRSAPGAFDCILAADALCYFGDLRPVFSAAGRALAKTGFLAFSVETFEGDGYRLERTSALLTRRVTSKRAPARRLCIRSSCGLPRSGAKGARTRPDWCAYSRPATAVAGLTSKPVKLIGFDPSHPM